MSCTREMISRWMAKVSTFEAERPHMLVKGQARARTNNVCVPLDSAVMPLLLVADRAKE